MSSEKNKTVYILLLFFTLVLLGLGLRPFAINLYKENMKEKAFGKLNIIRDLKKEEIQKLYEDFFDKTGQLSKMPLVISAFKNLHRAYNLVPNEITEEKNTGARTKSVSNKTSIRKRTKEYYSEEFTPKLKRQTLSHFSNEAFIPRSPRALLMQDYYIVQPSLGLKIDDTLQLIKPYHETHEKVHSRLKSLLE